MKLRIATALLCTVATLAHAQDKSIAGNWKLSIDVQGNFADFTCSILQEGKDLKGNCDTLGALKGTANGDTFTWETKDGQSPLTFTGKLTAEGNLNGSVLVSAYSMDGVFKAIPVK